MASKNPISPQNNRTSGKRLYVQDGSQSYVKRMGRTSDRALEYMLRAYKAFLSHSEFKKPYAAVNYEDMEQNWDLPDYPFPKKRIHRPITPGPGPDPDVPPDPGGPPNPPGPGDPPIPSPGPGPGPWIPPGGDPWWNNVYFCQIPDFEFCPGGPPVMVPVTTNDGITQAGVTFSNEGSASPAGNSVIYMPGGSTFGSINVTTRHGATCRGYGHAKAPALCLTCGTPSIGYTTTGMQINETQQLSVVGGGSGPFSWGVSGGGSINPTTGLYTAPASNANCSNNPTINLLCNGNVVATLALAINSWASLTDHAVSLVCSSCTTAVWNGSIYEWKCNCIRYNCAGTDLHTDCYTAYCWSSDPGGCGGGGFCATNCSTGCGIHDIRTGTMIAGGCCPPQLL